MIKKFTRLVLIVVMPISLITGCGAAEKAESGTNGEKGLYGLFIW